MTYRFAEQKDLPRLLLMVEQAKAGFRARGIDQWQKGDPNEAQLIDGISRRLIHVLEENGQAVAMITIVSGPEPSYDAIDGAWLNQEPYCAFHRVAVEESMKGQGMAALLFSHSQNYARSQGFTNVRIDTHPDNRSMQRALAKSGFTLCGQLILADGSEKGDARLGYQKIL